MSTEHRPDLATVEQWLRASAAESDPDSTALHVFLVEYDRRGKVEQAAAAYVMAGLAGDTDVPEHRQEQLKTLAALIEAVRTNENFDG